MGSIIVSRVIGNELKPREVAGAKIKVLQRILEVEAMQSYKMDCFWVVNHVYDHLLLKEYLDLLNDYQQQYEIIPFECKAYRKLRSFEDKIRYGTNVNAARNYGIKKCREHYKFVIAADGDCYFFNPERIWQQIEEDQLKHPDRKYYSIPGRRLHYEDHEAVVNNARDEEHVLILRQDAEDLFDENVYFGNGDARELFQRIGYITAQGTCTLIGHRSKVLKGFITSVSFSEDKHAEINVATRMRLREESLTNLAKEMDSLARTIF